MSDILQLLNSYISGGNNIVFPLLLVISFFAGILSSLSPCSLGMLPLIIAYVGGYSKNDNKKLLIQMLSFSFGLSFVLSIIGALCAMTGMAFTGFASPVLLLLFASVLVIMGLNLIGILEFNFPAVVKKMPQNINGGLFIYPFLVGAVFALAASPCSTPILLTIMAVAAVSKSIIFSILLLFAFAIGQCVIIILFAIFASALKNLPSIAVYSNMLIKTSGIILIIAGLIIYYFVFSGI